MTPDEVVAFCLAGLDLVFPSTLRDQLRAGLANARLHADPSVPTACIGPGDGRWEIRLGTAFCAEHVHDPGDAVLLLMHELLHAIDGHFELPPPRDATHANVRNVLLDILVNGRVLHETRMRPPELLRRLYDPDAFPAVLLTHPDDLLAHLAARDPIASAIRGAWEKHRAASAEDDGRVVLSRVQRIIARHLSALGVASPLAVAALYLEGWLRHPEPHNFCARGEALVGGDPRLEVLELTLLGDHDPSKPRVPGRGVGAGGPLTPRDAEAQANRSQIARFVRAVREHLDLAHSAKRRREQAVHETSVVPHAGRREAAALALGLPPVLYHTDRVQPAPAEEGVRLYLDVSGSLYDGLGLFLGLARGLGDELARPVWGWSTAVHPVDPHTRSRSRVFTTGGTDLGCVLEHALAHRFRRIVVVTDGEFDTPSPALTAAVRQRGVRVVFVPTQPRGLSALVLRRLGAARIDLPEVWKGSLLLF